jgi:nitrite reductase/ring-hydroxylating ferredoxin subunit
MSVKYIPVQWNKNKWLYDGIMLFAVVCYLWVFIEITPQILNHESPINAQVHNARAFGSCAFLMLSVILAIGPLARLDNRFLPLLYNRRHFGVMTVFVALAHAGYILDWYFAFSKAGKYEALLFANTSYTQLLGFPFEAFGIFALLCLLILATTSHDFWMKFLTPPVWKALHYLIYAAYISVVAHVSFGILQDQQNQAFPILFVVVACAVVGVHLIAAISERKKARAHEQSTDGWIEVCATGEMNEGYAKIAKLPKGDRVAVFLQDGKLSAISNACAHQNGPLGEGKIIDCLVTCPWHGFQYDVTNGRSPAPFTETVPTYNLAVQNGRVLVDPEANQPGTFVEPLALPKSEGGSL